MNDKKSKKVADNKCPECGNKLPKRKMEIRQGGYFEFISYCSCGATFTDYNE